MKRCSWCGVAHNRTNGYCKECNTKYNKIRWAKKKNGTYIAREKRPIIQEDEKYCSKCKKIYKKDVGFWKNAARYDGLNVYCKRCALFKQYAKRDRNIKKHRKKDAAQHRIARIRNPILEHERWMLRKRKLFEERLKSI